ncbi:MAG: hypothetical protein ABIZ34_05085 [Candidatus Limnocylindrales bacterium]
MGRESELRRPWRLLLFVAVVAMAIVGVASFAAPGWASSDFPWKVGPFLTMTIGGWCIGTAIIAWLAARQPRLDLGFPLLVYCWIFGAGQALVVIAFLDKLLTNHLLTVPYLVGIGAMTLSGVIGAVDLWRRRAAVRGPAEHVPMPARVFAGLYVVGVALIALGNLVAGADGTVAQGRFFPEALGLFSIRALAAFFFALSMAGLGAVITRGLGPYLSLGRAGFALIVPITFAALVNLPLFDFAGRPGGSLYLGAYLVVGGLILVALVLGRSTRREHA